MEYRALFCAALVLIAADFGQTRKVDLAEKNLKHLNDNEVFKLEDPSKGEKSALILLYDLSARQFPADPPNFEKNVTLSAPEGYGLFVAFIKIDFRPNSADTLTLSEPGTGNQKTYRNTNTDDVHSDKENNEQFYSPTGKIQVSFKTHSTAIKRTSYGGFELACTVQGDVNKPETCKSDFFPCDNKRCISKALRCNEFTAKYQHCGDGSDHTEKACNFIDDITISPEGKDLIGKATTSVGTIVGIVFGVIIALIVLGGLIVFLIFRKAPRR